MALRTLLKFRNLDLTRDINNRNVGLISPGIISGAEVTAVPGQLAVDVSPYRLASVDGMIVEETSATQRFTVFSGQITVIAIKAKYIENNAPVVEMVALPLATFLALADFEYYIICSYINVPSGQTQVLQSYISENPPINAPEAARSRDVIDPQGRNGFRGVLSNSGLLPAADNRLGDFYLVQDIARGVLNFFGWDGTIWKNMTDAVTLAVDLSSHRSNLFPNEKHLSDSEKAAVVGTSGVPVSESNKLIDNADTRIPYQNQKNALSGNPENPSEDNRFVTELYTLATPSEYTTAGAQATAYITLPFLSSGTYYGPFFVGNLSSIEAADLFKLYSTTLNREYVNTDGSAVNVVNVYKSLSPLTLLNPSVDADPDGYFGGTLYLQTSKILDASCTVRYGQKALFKQIPAAGDGVKFPVDMLLRSPPSDAQISSDVIEKVQAIKGTLWDADVPLTETNRALRRSVVESSEWAGASFYTSTVVQDFKDLPANINLKTFFESVLWSRSSGLVTVTSAAHGLVTGDSINVESSLGSPSGVSLGTKKITYINANQFYFSDAGSNATSTLTYSVQDFLKNVGISNSYSFSNDTGTSSQYVYTYTYNKSLNSGTVTYAGVPSGALNNVKIGNVLIDGSGKEYTVLSAGATSVEISNRNGTAPLTINTSLGGLSGYIKKDVNPREINLADFRLVSGSEKIWFNKLKRSVDETNPNDGDLAYEIEYPLIQETGEPRVRFYGGIVNDQLSSSESAVKVLDTSKILCTALATRFRLMYRSVAQLPVVPATWSSSGSTITVYVASGHGFVSSDVLNTIINVTSSSAYVTTTSFVITSYISPTYFTIEQTGIGTFSGNLSYYIPQQAKITVDGLVKNSASISASSDFIDLSGGSNVAFNLLADLQPRIDVATIVNGLSANQPHTVEIKFSRFYQFRIYGVEFLQNAISSSYLNSGRAFVSQSLVKNNTQQSISIPLVASQRRGLISYRYIDYSENLNVNTYELSDFDGTSDAPQGPVVSGSTDITLVAGVSKLDAYFRVGDVVKVRTKDVLTSEQYEEVKVIDSFPVSGTVRFTSPFTGGTSPANAQLYHLASTSAGSADPSYEYVVLNLSDAGAGYVSSSLSDFNVALTSTLRNRYFSFEDGCTSFIAYNSSYLISEGTPFLRLTSASGSTFRIVFVGSRLDFILGPCGNVSFTATVDGSTPITYSTFGSSGDRLTVLSNARYQSHEVYITVTSGNLLLGSVALFAPDSAIKVEGCLLGKHTALARYISSQAVAGNQIPTGSLCVDPLACGGKFINGTGVGSTWSVSTVTSPYLVYPKTSKVGSTFEYSFYGDAFEIDYLSHTGCGNHTVYINNTVASALNFPSITRWGIDSSSGKVNMASTSAPATPARKKFGVSGLTLGFQTIKIECAGSEMNVLHFYESSAYNNCTSHVLSSGTRKIIVCANTALDARNISALKNSVKNSQNITSANVYGIASGMDNPEGTLGENLNASPSVAVTPDPTSGVFKTVTSITLNPGKYLINGAVFINKAAINGSLAETSLSITPNAAGTGVYAKSRQGYPLAALISGLIHSGVVILKLEEPTTVYLTAALHFATLGGATYTTDSYIDAVRIG